MKKFILALLPIILFFPQYCLAHSGVTGGFNSGLTHPVLGLDHLLAMVSVGIISAQIGGRAVWNVPTVFVVVMAVGGALGMMNIGLIAIELGIAMSVVVLGFAITQGKKLPTAFILIIVAFFAIFHGYAHGLEIPELAVSWAYILGFMVGTAALHIAGVLIGVFAKKLKGGYTMLRYLGAVIAGMGLHILLGMYGF